MRLTWALKPVMQVGQGLGVVVGVVDVGEQAVLDGGDASGSGVEAFGGGDDVGDGVAAVGGDEAARVASSGAWRERARWTLRSASARRSMPGTMPTVRDGDLPPAEAAEVGVGDSPDGGDDVVEVVHGFAHAHEDERREPAVELRSPRT